MFGAPYFGMVPFATPPELITPVIRSGGGWAHRGRIPAMPPRRPTGLPALPKLPKPPYLFYTEDTE